MSLEIYLHAVKNTENGVIWAWSDTGATERSGPAVVAT
jgi:hypothetical protein